PHQVALVLHRAPQVGAGLGGRRGQLGGAADRRLVGAVAREGGPRSLPPDRRGARGGGAACPPGPRARPPRGGPGRRPPRGRGPPWRPFCRGARPLLAGGTGTRISTRISSGARAVVNGPVKNEAMGIRRSAPRPLATTSAPRASMVAG